jgi:hypothetical protein
MGYLGQKPTNVPLTSADITDGTIALADMSSQSVDEDNLHISNAGSNGQFLSKQSGDAGGLTWAAAGGGAWNMVGTSEASTSASLTVTGLDSTYDNYAIGISDITSSSDTQNAYIRLGDSSGIDSGASDYAWHLMRNKSNSASYVGQASNSTSSIQMGAVGTGTGEGMGGMLYLSRPADGTLYPVIHGTYTSYYVNTYVLESGVITGVRLSGISVDRVQIFIGAGNIVTGRLTVWGISHT